MPPHARCAAAVALLLAASLAMALHAPSAEASTSARDAGGCGDSPVDDALATAVTLLPVPMPGTPPELDACRGIRPGGALVFHRDHGNVTFCTMGFIVTDGRDLYVTTAGHCADPAEGFGPRFSAHGVPGTFGSLAFRWCQGTDMKGEGCGVGADFALIKVDSDKRKYVTGAMCKWGAPSGGVFRGWDESTRSIQHFGWGIVVGDASANTATKGNPATQAREGVGLDFGAPSYAVAETVATPGDSGSGVLVMPFEPGKRPVLTAAANPQALGVLTHVSAGGLAFVQRLDVSLATASVALKKTLVVVAS